MEFLITFLKASKQHINSFNSFKKKSNFPSQYIPSFSNLREILRCKTLIKSLKQGDQFFKISQFGDVLHSFHKFERKRNS